MPRVLLPAGATAQMPLLGLDLSYTAYPDLFQVDYRAAKRNKGAYALVYHRHNVLAETRAFGLEFEYDGPGGTERTVGQALYDAGLVISPDRLHWHARAFGPGQRVRHEYDRTVRGEVVTDILHDAPDTWDLIERVMESIAQGDGVISARCGGHGHYDTSDYELPDYLRLLRLFTAFEDVLYRVCATPRSVNHRGDEFCAPFPALPSRLRSVQHLADLCDGHEWAICTRGVARRDAHKRVVGDIGPGSHIELRFPDATGDKRSIQAQVKIGAALVSAAKRLDDRTVAALTPMRRGAHLARNPKERRLVGQEWAEQTENFRQFLDLLFNRWEDKQQVIGLFALTRWQPESASTPRADPRPKSWVGH